MVYKIAPGSKTGTTTTDGWSRQKVSDHKTRFLDKRVSAKLQKKVLKMRHHAAGLVKYV